jgi:hypothetical protein
MGHIRLPSLPKTKRWGEVVALLGSDSGTVAAIAAATLDAIDKRFVASGVDPGLVRVVWLLSKLPDAARSGSLANELGMLGVSASSSPTVAGLTAELAKAIDDHFDAHHRRTDSAEMALGAAVESLTRELKQRTTTLFPDASDVARALASIGTESQFGKLVGSFFARFTNRCLRSFVDRELPRHIGPGHRFRSLADQNGFSQALEHHCQQAAKIVETFAGSWWSKARHEGDLSEERTSRFVSYALQKMRDELRRGEQG